MPLEPVAGHGVVGNPMTQAAQAKRVGETAASQTLGIWGSATSPSPGEASTRDVD